MELGNYLATGIGSLPYMEPEPALDLILANTPQAPHWPQLPKISFREQMVCQYSEGLPGVAVDLIQGRLTLDPLEDPAKAYSDFYSAYESALSSGKLDSSLGISPECARGFHALEARLRASGAKLPLVKVQTCGPLTFSLNVIDQDQLPLYMNQKSRDLCVKLAEIKCLWQIQRLQPYAQKVICFIDEPMLTALLFPSYHFLKRGEVSDMISEVVKAVKKAGAISGIHCCGNTDWSIPLETGMDILSFDAFNFGDSLLLYADSVKIHLERGGFLAWGIVPTSGEIHHYSPEALAARLEGLLNDLVGNGLDLGLLAERALLTPSCGTGTLEILEAERVYETLAELSKLMKRKYGFEG